MGVWEMIFDKSHYSLTVGVPLRLTYRDDIMLVSDNKNVLTNNGMIYAPVDKLRPEGQARIIAVDSSGNELDTCDVTIVTWKANSLELTAKEIDGFNQYFEIDGVLYGYRSNVLYKSIDGFETREIVGNSNFTPGNYPFLQTPYGYFARSWGNNGEVYQSQDLLHWDLCFADCIRGLYHSFDYHFDEQTGLLYIYLGEYSADAGTNDRRHSVYRGVIDAQNNQTWDKAIEFYSVNEFNADPNNHPSARHVHVVTVDKYTGDVWVNVGDAADQCHLLVSRDNGDTWTIVGSGLGQSYGYSQNWRSLSIWFTQDYVYWNMDTGARQAINRLHRSKVPATDTIVNEHMERVQMLDNGSHWYHCKAVDDYGNEYIIMGQSAEGEHRDWRTRLFAIREIQGGEVEIQELISAPSDDPSIFQAMVQFEPRMQDSDGNIYANGRLTDFGAVRCRFVRKYRPKKYTWTLPKVFVN